MKIILKTTTMISQKSKTQQTRNVIW